MSFPLIEHQVPELDREVGEPSGENAEQHVEWQSKKQAMTQFERRILHSANTETDFTHTTNVFPEELYQRSVAERFEAPAPLVDQRHPSTASVSSHASDWFLGAI